MNINTCTYTISNTCTHTHTLLFHPVNGLPVRTLHLTLDKIYTRIIVADVLGVWFIAGGVTYRLKGGPLGVLVGVKGVETLRSRVGGDTCCREYFLCRSASANK